MRDWFRKNRILATRIAAVALLPVFLLSESAHSGTFLGTVLFALGLFLVGAGMMGRVWCSVYISGRKDRSLVVAGPYSVSRNPLYVSNFLGALGVVLATETLTLPVLTGLLFAVFYPPVIAQEEDRLREMFGEGFESYSRRTPRFFPDFRRLDEPPEYSVDTALLRRTIHSALWFLFIFGVIRILGDLHRLRVLPSWLRLY